MRQSLSRQSVPFSQIANSVLNDKRLSWKAKGIFAYLYSKPEDWDFSAMRMVDDSTDKYDALMTGIRELEKFGFLSRKKRSDGKTEYHVSYDPGAELPYYGKSPVGEIHGISNKEDTSNKEEETKKASARLLASAVPGIVLGSEYKPDGNRPRRNPVFLTPKQREAFSQQRTIDKFISRYREEAKRRHQLTYFHRDEDLNPKIRKLFSTAYARLGEELMDFVDWILSDKETWHGYEPEQCMTMKMIRRYENREALAKLSPVGKKQRIISFAKEGGDGV